MTLEELDLQAMGVRPHRHKPSRVQAVELRRENVEAVAEWCGGHIEWDPLDVPGVRFRLWVPTDQGPSAALPGHRVVRRVGKFWPMTPGEFANQYDDIPSEG